MGVILSPGCLYHPGIGLSLYGGDFVFAMYLYKKGAAESSIPILEHLARLTEIVRQGALLG